MDPHRITTIAAAGTALFRDRGSRFLAFAHPIGSESEARIILRDLRKEHPKANHHCYALRVGGDGNLFRAVDDGEPAGSAGKPILAAIDSAGVTNTLVVVVRYFGGTLLGVPGLIHAYRTTAADALAPIPRAEQWLRRTVTIHADYPDFGLVLRHIRLLEGTIIAQETGLFCTVTAGIPIPMAGQLTSVLGSIRNIRLEWE